MKNIRRRERFVLVVGDIILLIFSLWLMLLLRHLSIPSWELYLTHLVPFSLLFVVFIFIFFVAGLYEKHTSFLKRELPGTVFAAQIVNVVLAAAFFFLIPYFGIAPKTNLVIYLAVSSLLVVLWRLFLFPFFEPKRLNKTIVIGTGKELEEVVEEIQNSGRYRWEVIEVIDMAHIQNPNEIQKKVLKHVVGGEVSDIVIDTHGKYADMLTPLFYNLTFVQSQVHVINLGKLYEEMFDRVPLSQLDHDWMLENLELSRRPIYETAKRAIDIVLSLVVMVLLLFITPLVYCATRLEGKGDLFIQQERMGKNGEKITILKFRTMTHNKAASSEWTVEEKQDNKVTNVGAFLRKTSIDELPQVFSVLKGDVSFIGPRSDITGLAERLAEAIPFYNARYKVTPGISGWAQINQRYAPGNISPQSIEESRVRLAYDLYYVKHRSLWLDIAIALRTIKTLVVRIIPHGT